MKIFFVSILGKKWKKKLTIWILITFLVISLPIILFYKKIKFNPAAFTQDWIRTTITVFIIYFIVEYQKFSTDINRKRKIFYDYVAANIIKPTEEFRSLFTEKDSFDLVQVKARWKQINSTLSNFNLSSFNLDSSIEKLQNFKTNCNVDFADNYIKSLNKKPNFDDEEYIKTLNIIGSLLYLFKTSI